jgi:hypothetical protein
MSDRFESDAMEDLLYEEAEGPSRFEEFEEEGFEELDAGEEDEFLSRVIGGIGQVAGSLLGAEEFEEMEEWEDVDSAEAWDSAESMEDAVADAMEAEDTDEFLRRLRRIAGRAINVARRVGRGVGQVARVVAPIASAVPLPQAQAIGRIASIAGRLLADGADEFEVVDELVDLADEEDSIDAAAPLRRCAAAPLITGLTIRRTMPGVSRLPRATRRNLVRSVSQATRTLARRQGPQAARAVPRIVRTAQRAVRQRRIPARAVPQVVRRTAARVARSPQAVRRLAGPAAARPTRIGIGGGSRASCPACGGRGTYTLRGPVRVTIQGR